MKTNKIFIIVAPLLFIAAVTVLGVCCATKQVSHPLEKALVPSQISTPEKKETVKTPAAAVQLSSTSIATSINTPKILPSKPTVQETIKIEKPSVTTNTTGPIADTSTEVESQPLPVFTPVQNYTGPIPVIQTTSADKEITGFNLENTPVNTASGPPVDSNKNTKKLPPFVPVANETGPTKVNQ